MVIGYTGFRGGGNERAEWKRCELWTALIEKVREKFAWISAVD